MKLIAQKLWMFIAMLCVSMSANAYNFDFEVAELKYTILSSVNKTVAVVGGTSGIIPCTVTYDKKTYTVIEIGKNAFSHDTEIKEFRLPLSLKIIRENAFGYTKASVIGIPDSVETIESDAFCGASAETILIGPNVKTIGKDAFYECDKLKTLIFKSQKAPSYESEGSGKIGNKYTTVIVPQIQGYKGSSIAKSVAGTIIEPLSFKTKQFEYFGKIPQLDYVVNINSATVHAYKSVKSKDVGEYKQSYYVELPDIIPEWYYIRYDGYSDCFRFCGFDVVCEYSINKKPLNIKIDNCQRLYGDPNPSSYSYSIDGFVDGEDETQLISPVNCETTATLDSQVGNYPIKCNPEALNYSFEIKEGILTIQKVPIEISISNCTRIYGDDNPLYLCKYKGLRCGDTEQEITSMLQFTDIDKTAGCGDYEISVVDGKLRNYYINKVNSGILSITPAPLILTAKDVQRTYFTKNPEFDFSLTGLRNNDGASCILTKPVYTCDATMSSDCGEYEIIPSNAKAKNYDISYRSGKLLINRRQLTASVGKYTKTYGEENPEFDVVYTGFVNNEDKSVLTAEANAVCSANKASDVGTYPITVDGGSAVNYIISQYNPGKLTITKANQTLTWNQDLSDIQQHTQITLEATSNAGLPVSYEMSPNNVATLYNNSGTWYLDCFGAGAVSIRAVQTGDKNHNAAETLSKTLVVLGTGGGSSDPQIYLNVEKAGTLSSLIAENRKYQIKNLCLTGFLNGTDINFLREMAGSDSYGNKTMGVLEVLDISGCSVVSGGRNYYKSYYTENHKISDYMFYNCKVLVNLLLPKNTSMIGDFAFADCDRLSAISIPDEVKSFGVQSFRNDISLYRIPMPQSLTSIGDMAFMGCNGIADITLPLNVKTIGEGIVKGCQNISGITVDPNRSLEKASFHFLMTAIRKTALYMLDS